jgi:4-amino-4-deoxy-L-arabinose transferase-like glycosyltransferase
VISSANAGMGESVGRATRAEIWLVALFAVVPLLPFVPKAVSIDAPVFVAVANQILAHPFDPFGFQMIWDPTSPDAWVFNRNPPLLSYYLALWIAAFGEVDAWLHVAMLPFSLLAGLSFLGIARRLTGEGVRPTLLLIATPCYLILATTVMLDVALLGFMLFAVYALLRGAEAETEAGRGGGWQIAAGLAAAAAGLTKYVGFSIWPLLAAALVLLTPRRVVPMLRVLLPPLLIWGAWGIYTAVLYGSVHFAGSTDVVLDRGRFDPNEFWNHMASTPIYYGCCLIFPMFVWARALLRGNFTTGLAVAGALLGAIAVNFVRPAGDPARRVPLQAEEAFFAALGLAGAVVVWGVCFRPSRFREGAVEQFLLLWLGGVLCFSWFLNWHVNAADALLAVPPVVLLVFRDAELRPSTRALTIWLVVMLPLSLALAWADLLQANVYRDAAPKVMLEIGDREGGRYFVGHWGLQHYLAKEGFESVVPPQYGRSDLEVDDWVATARNISQLDVRQNMAEFKIRPVWVWEFDTKFPLRTTNADAGGGFYSHHSGYTPFAWSSKPLDAVGLGRVVGVLDRSRRER